MHLALSIAAILAVLAAVAFFFLFRRLITRDRTAPSDMEWYRDFSAAKYRPMERLFSESDYDFLASQPGFSPRIYKRLQAERRRVFGSYLRLLSRDFDRLSTAAKLLLVNAPEDRPDLASTLLKQRLVFWYAMSCVEIRLKLQSAGIGSVDVRPLVDALEGMRSHLRLLTESVQPSAV